MSEKGGEVCIKDKTVNSFHIVRFVDTFLSLYIYLYSVRLGCLTLDSLGTI